MNTRYLCLIWAEEICGELRPIEKCQIIACRPVCRDGNHGGSGLIKEGQLVHDVVCHALQAKLLEMILMIRPERCLHMILVKITAMGNPPKQFLAGSDAFGAYKPALEGQLEELRAYATRRASDLRNTRVLKSPTRRAAGCRRLPRVRAWRCD